MMTEPADIDALVAQAEADIDRAFACSGLLSIGYAQAVWTILSVNEDTFLRAVRDADSENDLHMFVDGRLNQLSHPLRICFKQAEVSTDKLDATLIDEHYKLAWDWLEASLDYDRFCSIFPLWHRKRIKLGVSDNIISVGNIDEHDVAYEAYNRLIRKDGKTAANPGNMPPRIFSLLKAATVVGKDDFHIKFNPRLVGALRSWLAPIYNYRHTLPEDWSFDGFTLQNYRSVYSTLQSMLFAWRTVRNDLAGRRYAGTWVPIIRVDCILRRVSAAFATVYRRRG